MLDAGWPAIEHVAAPSICGVGYGEMGRHKGLSAGCGDGVRNYRDNVSKLGEGLEENRMCASLCRWCSRHFATILQAAAKLGPFTTCSITKPQKCISPPELATNDIGCQPPLVGPTKDGGCPLMSTKAAPVC